MLCSLKTNRNGTADDPIRGGDDLFIVNGEQREGPERLSGMFGIAPRVFRDSQGFPRTTRSVAPLLRAAVLH